MSLTPEQQRLFELLAAQEEDGVRDAHAPRPLGPDQERPLSFAQERFWLLDRLDPGNPAFHMPLAVRLAGDLDVAVLERALAALVARQESLRTHFARADDGTPRQVIEPAAPVWLPVTDLERLPAAAREHEARRLMAAETARSFELATRAPVRLRILRLGAREHQLLVVMHHIVTDGWSLAVMTRELGAFYQAGLVARAAALPELPFRYADFAAWQRRRLSGEVLEEELGYWRRQLQGFGGVLELPTDRPRAPLQSFRGASRQRLLSAELSRGLEALARRHDASLFMALLAAFMVLLHRWSGQSDVAVGTPIAGRDRAEVQGLVGLFLNTLVLRADLSGAPSFVELLAQVRETSLGAYAHQEVPFEKLLEELRPERDLSRPPLVQVFFNMLNLPGLDVALEGLEISGVTIDELPSKLDLTLYARQRNDQIHFELQYNSDLFTPERAVEMLDQYELLLEQVVAAPGGRLDAFTLVSAEARHVLPDPHRELDAGWHGAVHGMVWRSARRTPERPAVVSPEGQWTYRELEEASRRLAGRLMAAGVGPGDVVAVYAHRSAILVWAILGTLEAGAAFVVLDPAYPARRLAGIVALACPRAWLELEAAGPLPPELERAVAGLARCPRIRLPPWAVCDADGWQGDPSWHGPRRGPDDLACIAFTSGSTGLPKGILGRHGPLSHFLPWQRERFDLGSSDRFSLLSGLAHDPLQRDIFTPLAFGATLCLPDPEDFFRPGALAEWMRRAEVSVAHLTPAMAQLLTERAADRPLATVPSLRWVFTVGDVLTWRDVARLEELAPRTRVVNLYGSTESQRAVGYYPVPAAPGRQTRHGGQVLPLGRGMPDVQLLVVNASGGLAGVGELGEIHLRSPHLARGYLGDDELTRARFLANPWGERHGDRLYRTGDLGRYLSDGNVAFAGRADQQVQIRGFRVELGEIEARLSGLEGVRQAVVLATDGSSGRRLVGYVTGSGELETHRLRRELSRELPEYMVPSRVVVVERLPLLPNGKVDRAALRRRSEKDLIAATAPAAAAPRTEMETMIAAVLSEVLELESVDVSRSFFDLGANSLLLVRFEARLEEILGREIATLEIFQHPSVRALAAHLVGEPQKPAAKKRLWARSPTAARGAVEIAIIGMAGRFPGARNVEEFWQNLAAGFESITFFSDDELLALGEDDALLKNLSYVKAARTLEGVELFDADFFGMSPREAEITDPQQRLFLECAWQALEDAGYDPQAVPGLVGVYAGARLSTYLRNLYSSPEIVGALGGFQVHLGNDKDYLAARVAYKLGFSGPAVAVQTACSTSLVATHMACQALTLGDCDAALAGGVALTVPQGGYLYREGEIFSRDGRVRPFDAAASGTVFGNGLGVVVLKRLDDALEDRDAVRAVIRGSAVNNDSRHRVGFTAPAVAGQAEVVRSAHLAAGIDPETITYVEAHGTATPTGDPIEVKALEQAFRESTPKKGFCAIGSVKGNVGHLSAAAGAAGLIKTVLALERRQIPASLNYEQPNPQIDFAASPFHVQTELGEWPANGAPRRAGVSSFGLGGTNAHLVLEEAPAPKPGSPSRPWQLLVLSARSPAALETATRNLAAYLEARPELDLADAAFTLRTGRQAFEHRRTLVCRDTADAAAALADPRRQRTAALAAGGGSVAFAFPGRAALYPGLGEGLYRSEPAFRQAVEHAGEILRPRLALDLEDLLFPPAERRDEAARRLAERRYGDAALFVTQVALTRLWMEWGVRPAAIEGDGVGEYAAAHVAGEMELEEALRLVTSTTARETAGLEKSAKPADEPGRVFLVMGPSRGESAPRIVPSLRRRSEEGDDDQAFLLDALARLWLAGVEIDWGGFHAHERRRRVPLPTYPFEGRRHWVDLSPDLAFQLTAARAIPAASSPRPQPRTASAGDLERQLCEIWQEVLGLEEVGVHDDFFELGCDSLVLTRLASRTRERLALAAPLEDFLASTTVAELSARLAGPRESAAEAPPELERVARGGELPVSFSQLRLWFLDQLQPGTAAYNISFALRLAGDLDVAALRAALSEILRRHEVLRTVFIAREGREPRQRILAAQPFDLAHAALDSLPEAAWRSEVERQIADEATRPFDLERGPFLRARLLSLAPSEHALVFTLHHIAGDGWSLSVLARELVALYGALPRGSAPLPELPVQYADFAVWQRRWLSPQRIAAEVDFWRRQLAGAPPLLELPADRPRPESLSGRGDRQRVSIPAALTGRLKELGRRHGATLFMTLLAGYQALLGRLSAQLDVSAGTAVAGRNHPRLEGLIGFFVNTLVMRTDLAGDPTAGVLLGRVRRSAHEAFEHQHLPFEKLVEELSPERSLGHTPLFQAMLVLQNLPVETVEVSGLSFEPLPAGTGATKFDLTLQLEEAGGALSGSLAYSTDLYDRSTVNRWRRHLVTLLGGMTADLRFSELPLLAVAERFQVLREWGGAGPPPEAALRLHELVERQAARCSEATAIVHGCRTISYGELDRRGADLARELTRRGAGPELPVAIVLRRTPAAAVALLAVWKAGGYAVPLDPEQPPTRRRRVLERCGCRLVLTEEGLDAIGSGGPAGPLPRRGGPEALAYVVHTSGSTGEPKGVACHHRGAVSYLTASTPLWELTQDDVVLQRAALSFDASIRDLVGPLAAGARVVVLDEASAKDPRALVESLDRHGITAILSTVPSLLDGMVRAAREGPPVEHPPRLVVSTGEALRLATCRGLFEVFGRDVRVLNHYGPTEGTMTSTVHRMAPPAPGRGTASLGRPIAGVRTWVVDRALRAVPPGVVGEIVLGGAGLARGYHLRPAMTAAAFPPCPFGDGGQRLYRTGDLGRFRASGELEIAGRLDHQVKLRGYRVEPGEVEAALATHPEVERAVVLVEELPEDQRLVACVVPRAAPTGAELLRRHLAERLPDYMLPAAFAFPESLPLLPNGKVDRRQLLRSVEGIVTAGAEAPYVAPRSPAEERLAGIFAEVLQLDRVGVDDNFFQLGGHSLLATRVASRVRSSFSVELPLAAIFEAPTVAGLGQVLRRLDARRARGVAPPVRRRPDAGPAPLSFAQERLWFLHCLDPASEAHNLPGALSWRGPLDVGALRRSVGEIVRRHEVLRTTFRLAGGTPVQVVSPPPASHEERALWLPRVDLTALPDARRQAELRRQVERNVKSRFDLGRGPLVRSTLLELGGDEWALLFTMHHIASDLWSLALFVREIGALYPFYARGGGGAPPLAELPVQYADYAVWQREHLAGEALEEQLDYWRRRLGEHVPVLELPADRPRRTLRIERAASREHRLPPRLAARLAELCRSADATLFMVLLAGFQTVLGRYAGQPRVVVGTPIANRRLAEVEPLIGFFVNTLVLAADLGGDPPFAALLGQVRETTLGAYAHQDLPFERLVQELRPERDLTHTPLVQVMLALQNQPREALALPGVDIEPLAARREATAFDLVLGVFELDEGIRLRADFRSGLFDATTVERFLRHFENLLARAAERPAARLSELVLASRAQRQQMLVEWNDTARDLEIRAAGSRGATLAELLAEVAARVPGNTALVLGERRLSYRELDERAARLARALRRHGVGAEVVVAISLERSFAMVIAMIGVWKAGGAWLPIDPASPAKRRDDVLAASGAALLLTRPQERHAFGGVTVPVWIVDETGEAEGGDLLPALGEATAAGRCRPANPAYVIYTSGSSGRPKGVTIPHEGVVNTLLWRLEEFALTEDDAVLQNISFTFDPSLWQILGALLSGARLVLVPPGGERDFYGLVGQMAEEGVTITDLAPSMLQVFLDQRQLASCDRLRLLFAGGEAMPPSLRERFLSTLDADLRNIYGPTETSIDAACWRCRPGGGATVPIGRPIANKRLVVADAGLETVPVGVAGQLWIGGAGLARGYLGRPDLTAESFLPDPWSSAAGARLYRTGDLVRHRSDGALSFLGRVDRQVKVRGFRIELGEVEAALGQHPAVEEAAVLAAGVFDARGRRIDTRLLGYYVGDRAGAREVRTHLKQRLPAYMVPAVLRPLAALPRTAGGKVDYQALERRPPDTEEKPAANAASAPPRTGLERTIAVLWREVLGLEEVGADDNFFDVGGHSLLLVRLHAMLQEGLGREVPIVDLFNYPTVRSLARHLDPATHFGSSPARVRHRAAAPDAAYGSSGEAVAVLSMVGRFPGAASVDELWEKLRAGEELIVPLDDEALTAAGVSRDQAAAADFVRAGTFVDGVDLFDAGFFDMTPREAELLDPQQRLFLEAAWEALEEAGYDSARYDGRIGVYAGVSSNSYLFHNLLANPELMRSVGLDQAALASEKDFLATRVSYKLDLKGPSLTVQTACSTSLVAVHLAARALLDRQCDMALAGGSSLKLPQGRGYLYRDGGTTSPDGHCRAFDADARGMVSGNGLGVVVLKRLSRALADGDPIRAVIRGTAINNDGAFKVGYTAPGVAGQAEVIATAQQMAGVRPEEIGYVEAHGTGTPLGDPIEIAALAKVFGPRRPGGPRCAVGSIKTNIGHLDAAAGVAGLIKAALAVERGQIPPSLNYERPNPRLGLEETPFYVATALSDWPVDGPRRAGVSSFGIGGTNAHAVIEEPPRRAESGPSRPWQLLVLSARSAAALDSAAGRVAGYLDRRPDVALADVAYTLLAGRRAFAHRRIVVARDPAEAAAAFAADSLGALAGTTAGETPRVSFLFPGQGSQHAGMAEALYRSEPRFRDEVDSACTLLEPHLGLDLRELLLAPPERRQEAGRRLRQTALAQPAIFVVSYALARLWTAWGVSPMACLGHSIGEYVAATLAGVFRLEDALGLVALRGRLMQALPPGSMLSVGLSADEVSARLPEELALAAVNGPQSVVVSGPTPEVGAFARSLEAEGASCRALHTSHAFHSAMMDPILDDFAAAVAEVRREAPGLPFVSNLTGTWIRPEEAADPGYWAEHLRRTVRFADGLRALLDSQPLLLEVGPGRTLSTLARRTARDAEAVASLGHPRSKEPDDAVLLRALGRLWARGVEIDAKAFFAGEQRCRLRLPTYPFERRRFWVEPASSLAETFRLRPGKAPDPADWFYAPTWRESVLPRPPANAGERRWLVFLDRVGLGEEIVRRLRERGQKVVTVARGEAFSRADDERYILAPGESDGYVRLLAGLGESPSRVVHLWNVTGGPGGGLETLGADLDLGFYSLLFLAQALAGQGLAGAEPLELTVVSDGLHPVRGDEALAPVKATLLGPVRVMPLELPGIRCRSVDVDAGGADGLVAELLHPVGDPVVAWRGGRRWIQAFEPVASEPAVPPLRDAGVYLITGGLGGIGLELAHGIAQAVERPRLALLGRTAIEAQGPRRDKLRALEARGAEVLTLRADVSDPEAMGEALGEIRRRFGALHGVVHAAGVAGGGLIPLRDAEAAGAVLAPKVRGTLTLEALLEGERPDFVVLCSSLAAHLGGVGQVDYAAANAFLDAWAASRPGAVAIAWDTWSEAGMALAEARSRGHSGERLDHGLSSVEGVDVFYRALADARSRTIVSTLDFNDLAGRFAARRDTGPELAAAAPTTAPASHERPELSTPYAAPRNDTEERVVAVLEEVLGIERVGIHDDFTELGGDSLLAVQVVSRLRRELGVGLALTVLFETPTAAQIALRVVEAVGAAAEPELLEEMLAGLDSLSEEEARALLAAEEP